MANTAAGRRRYMQYLIPQVVASDIVDRYDIWVNTMDKEDIAFFRKCAEAFPKIRLVWQPDGVVDGVSSINAFYRDCCEEDAVYIKLDDDLVWLEPGFFQKMADFRIGHPEYFVVSPLVINNMMCVYILQAKGRLKMAREEYFRASFNYKVTDGAFAADLHDWFLKKLEDGSWEGLHCGAVPWGLGRFSINSISWFGADFRKLGGVIPGDDEEYLSCVRPAELGLANCVNGDCLCAHFAFFTQRGELDKLDILERYGGYMARRWAGDAVMRPPCRKVAEALAWVRDHRDEIQRGPDAYRRHPVSVPVSKRLKRLPDKLRVPTVRMRTLADVWAGLHTDNRPHYIERQ